MYHRHEENAHKGSGIAVVGSGIEAPSLLGAPRKLDLFVLLSGFWTSGIALRGKVFEIDASVPNTWPSLAHPSPALYLIGSKTLHDEKSLRLSSSDLIPNFSFLSIGSKNLSHKEGLLCKICYPYLQMTKK